MDGAPCPAPREGVAAACLALVAAQIARLVLAAAEDGADAAAAGDALGPVLVLEVADVHRGRLSFLVVTELLRLRSLWPDPASPPFLYVLGATTRRALQALQDHAALQALARQGLVDFSEVDFDALCADRDVNIVLERCKRRVNGHRPWRGPIMPILVHAASALRTNAFRVTDGDLQLGARDVDIEGAWRFCEIAPGASLLPGSNPGGRDDLQWLLDDYGAEFFAQNAAFSVPVAAIATLGRLREVCTDKIVGIICDRGVVNLDQQRGRRAPAPGLNFHALHRIAQSRWHGAVFTTPHCATTVSTCIAISSRPGCRPLTAQLAVQWLDSAPRLDVDAYIALERSVARNCANGDTELSALLAILRLANHDPHVFFRLRNFIVGQTPFATPRQAQDLIQDVAAVRARCFVAPYTLAGTSPQTTKDVAFHLGRVLMGLRRYASALDAFQASKALAGEHAATLYNIGVCAFHCGTFDLSAESLQKSLALNPHQPGASAWRARAIARLGGIADHDHGLEEE
ncbi:UDP-N-acetylglucosamine--peptide N-acetylglucosaminyltransferase [Hondaea fermentalgiana]|uniref:UDP-N-acetylglucosamine--peptide N-acetylglucosaminyltransferase n=1 Tax=Hondaea fermentalgiana TaxID=2315210 RepID=A0A2R5GQB6_9STRA|nr:UDP-N-acetylglucosamine--peptide N-acetylglucosaminyltransferase [Hondaea fermentalgiana]|eukprot:GBG30551.1 UDP-N-acetylglucosamine--peptide N-acetylglucosaminyltransferase [Hondaea fermentalgiana]